MPIKTILVPLEGTETGTAPLEAALIVARAFDAHMEVLHPAADPQTALSYAAEPISGASAALVMEAAESGARAMAEKARALFDGFCKDRQVTAVRPGEKPPEAVFAVWREETGVPGRIVARLGRLADLIVVARPLSSDPAPELLETALLETGRPLLVSPPDAPGSIGSHVAIAWNGSAECAGVLTAAMPFLGQAGRVTVLTVIDGVARHADPADVAAYLSWHGIGADAVRIESARGEEGMTLLDETARRGGDLLVMGGYGHSRVREIVFGGVTRHVLAHATIPVLMAH